jgi:CRISPR/Cas system-associated exonuclease Cas4 (RecB family)
MNKDYVLASELGEYVYCKRAWWLRQHGLLDVNARMIEGENEHNMLTWKLLLFRIKFLFSLFLLIAGLVLIAIYYFFYV